MIKKFLLSPGTRDASTSVGLLILRVGIGAMIAIGHGLPKLRNWGDAVENWKTPDFILISWMSAPVSFAALIFAELICGILLVLGLVTRVSALIIGFAMAIAAFHHHAADPFFIGGGAAKEPAVLYLVSCLALLVIGAGAYSVDALLYKGQRRWGR